jgi:hypothetical protein
MKRALLIFICLLFVPAFAQAQMILDTFDSYDSTQVTEYQGDYPGQWLAPEIVTDNVKMGTGAMRIPWQNQCVTQWGGWLNVTHTHPDSLGYYDMSLYTEFSIWIYVESPSTVTTEVDLRFMLRDMGPESDIPAERYEEGNQEVWISQHLALDAAPGWNEIVVPLTADYDNPTPSDGWGNPNWSGAANDGELNLEHIRAWQIEWSQRGGLWSGDVANIGTVMDSVSGIVLFDHAQLQGVAPVELVYFNGKNVPGNVTMGIGWSGSVEVTDEESADEGTGSIKWAGGAGWDAVNFTHASPRNMLLNWNTDSLQFKIKAEAGIGDLTLNFWDVDHDPDGKDDYSFTAAYTLTELSMGYDGTWKEVKVALTDFNRFAGVWDGDLGQSVVGEFDSTEVAKFSMGNTGTAITTDVYFDQVWTGNPEFDFIPPVEVTGVSGTGGDYYNLVFWEKVAGEKDESYSVYASANPITDINAAGIEVVVIDQPASEGLTVTHWLQYPLKDTAIDYYYAVTCKDAAGNVGPPGKSSAVNNTAEGVATIHYMPGFTFKADGDFKEWDGVPVSPWKMFGSTSNVGAGAFDDDADLTATTYMAMDDDYLYIAADVTDNVFEYDAGQVASWWTQDALELFIGLWDQNGKAIHTKGPADSRGAEPDYKLVFVQDRYYNEYKNIHNGVAEAAELTPDPDGNGSYFFEEFGGADYALEAKISLDSIAFGDDARFHPENGMRIMFDLIFHDNDAPDDVGGGNLTWSPNNTDLAYLSQAEWTNTWIGDTTAVSVTSIQAGADNIAMSYELYQNYPNPFNPETTIEFALAKQGKVSITIFNMLGQNVLTLVDENMNAGTHQVQLDASSLASGIYFYSIRTADFFKTRKMILLK